jgi:GTP-binding protein
MAKGRRVKIRYATQVSTRPPTFVLFVSQANALPDSYLRYLSNGLRETFDLPGVPLRLLLRTGDNPYV